MINYLSPYSFCLLSTCNKTGVSSELNSCKQEHSTWENSQNSFWHFQPQNVRICQWLKHWISLPHIKKDNISFLDSETSSNLHPTAIGEKQNNIHAACGYHAESCIFTHLLRSKRVSMPRIWRHHVTYRSAEPVLQNEGCNKKTAQKQSGIHSCPSPTLS